MKPLRIYFHSKVLVQTLIPKHKLLFPPHWVLVKNHHDADVVIIVNKKLNDNHPCVYWMQDEPSWSFLANAGENHLETMKGMFCTQGKDSFPKYQHKKIPFKGSTVFPFIDIKKLRSKELKKKKKMSIVVSNQHWNTSQETNYEFRKNVVDWILSTNMNIDIFGKGIQEGRPQDSRIKGFVEDKGDALYDYEFTIAIENCNVENYQTEKLNDCLLCESIPLYCGDPIAFEIYDSPILLNKKNFKKVIWETYYNEIYDKKTIVEDKKKYLNQYSIVPLLEKTFKNDLNL